jgi:hypothetical protein
LTITDVTPDSHYKELVRRQRAELQDAYLKGVRRLRWDAGRLAAERERRLRELLLHAADRSPFWKERLAGLDLANFTEADLPSLPILSKAEMMSEFDRLVTIPGLTRARVKQHLDELTGDGYIDDEYRAIVTSGYTENPSYHVYGWDSFVTFVMQGSRWTGRRGEDPDAVLAQCFSGSPKHESGIFYALRRPDIALLRCHPAAGRDRRRSEQRQSRGDGAAGVAKPDLGARDRGDARPAHHHADLGQHRGGGIHSAGARSGSGRVGDRAIGVLGLLGGHLRLPMRHR